MGLVTPSLCDQRLSEVRRIARGTQGDPLGPVGETEGGERFLGRGKGGGERCH